MNEYIELYLKFILFSMKLDEDTRVGSSQEMSSKALSAL